MNQRERIRLQQLVEQLSPEDRAYLLDLEQNPATEDQVPIPDWGGSKLDYLFHLEHALKGNLNLGPDLIPDLKPDQAELVEDTGFSLMPRST